MRPGGKLVDALDTVGGGHSFVSVGKPTVGHRSWALRVVVLGARLRPWRRLLGVVGTVGVDYGFGSVGTLVVGRWSWTILGVVSGA